jgi:hypothetical protein
LSDLAVEMEELVVVEVETLPDAHALLTEMRLTVGLGGNSCCRPEKVPAVAAGFQVAKEHAFEL